MSHRSLSAAKVNARLFARKVFARGEIVQDIYAYQWPRCDRWRLTRKKEWNGKPLQQVYIAAPVEMQRWAMRKP